MKIGVLLTVLAAAVDALVEPHSLSENRHGRLGKRQTSELDYPAHVIDQPVWTMKLYVNDRDTECCRLITSRTARGMIRIRQTLSSNYTISMLPITSPVDLSTCKLRAQHAHLRRFDDYKPLSWRSIG